jgi:hypothetical protein
VARSKRAHGPSRRSVARDEEAIDVAVIGQGVGNFETMNGMPQGIVGAALVVLAVVLVRPIVRAVRAFLRG